MLSLDLSGYFGIFFLGIFFLLDKFPLLIKYICESFPKNPLRPIRVFSIVRGGKVKISFYILLVLER